ncbi:MAG: hypothetical protein M3409_06445, partial [Gemmatimonadota bacterium]|nr:hypothetical protein [Gemmatimonadota bacterium]
AGLLGRAAQMRAEHVGLACTRIARWAQSRGALTTELEFVHAAALACPGDPRLALAVGRVTRDRGEYLQAETWYGRTVGLARQVADWETYARAYVGLGNMWVARGVFPAARKTLLKAARCAERRSIRDVHGMALHDLFVVEMECQRDEDGYRYAEAALRVYGSGHSLLPTLAHDVAYFWLARGRFGDALSVLRAMIPRIPAHRHVQVHGNIARAAGAIGDERTFEDASNAVRAASDEAPGKADALVEIARAALSLGRWERAEDAAEQALKIARARGEAKIVFVAEGVMESSRNEHAAHSASQCNAPGRKESTPAKETAAPFALNLVRSLEAIAVGA